MIGRRLRHGRRREQDATKERDAERVGAAAHRLPCLLGCRCIVAVRASRASIISFRLLNGRLKTGRAVARTMPKFSAAAKRCSTRSEEHTSELQSPCNLVCRLLLEKKKSIAPPVGHGCLQRPVRGDHLSP